MADTNFLGMTYPDENQDPYFDVISSFYADIDSRMYGLIAIQQPLLGGGFIGFTNQSFNPFVGVLTWTENFEILIPGSGVYLQVPYGPDQSTRSIQLFDGDRVIISVPNTSTGEVTGYINKINGALTKDVVNLQGLYTVGIYRGGVFYSNLPKTLP
jgi:hypothetical protein